jgi:hypothetical protein
MTRRWPEEVVKLPPGNWRLDPFTRVVRYVLDPEAPMVPNEKGNWVQPCGTIAAHKRHRQHGEPVCEPCRIAVRDYKRAQRRARTYQDAA